jgi:hypothetical protein
MITNKTWTTIINALFGSVENYKKCKTQKFYPEVPSAMDFMRNHNVTDDNVEEFARMFLRRIPGTYVDYVEVVGGIFIPHTINTYGPKGTGRGRKPNGYVPIEKKIYNGMYSVVYKLRCEYRYEILNGDAETVMELSQEVFNEWLSEYTSLNAGNERAMELVKDLTCPKLYPNMWKR